MHLEFTLLHISPDSLWQLQSTQKNLKSHWIWCLGLLCCPIPPLPLQNKTTTQSLCFSHCNHTIWKKTMKEPDFSLAKASLGCAQVHVEIHFPVAAGMQLMGGWRGGKATPWPYFSLGSWDPSLPTKHLPKSWPEGSSEAVFKSKQLTVKALSISTLWRKQRIYCVIWV